MRRLAAALSALILPLTWAFPVSSLVGSAEIPRDLPGLTEQKLAESGGDWPTLAGPTDLVAPAQPRAESAVARAARGPDADGARSPTQPPRAEPPQPQERSAERPPARSEAEGPRAAEPADQETPVEAEPESAGSDGSGPSRDDVQKAEAYLNSLGTRPPGLAERLGRDPVGNGLAIVILLGMLASLVGVASVARGRPDDGMPGLVIPVLLLVGIGIAAYMTYVETQGASALCGPVGDCNAVQHSPYARVFGLIPVGLVGVIGYLLLLGAWAVARVGDKSVSDYGTAGFFLFAFAGTAFAAYLTFLEPFVIGAVCMWCLSSAVLITALLLLSARAGVGAVRRLRGAAAV